MSNPGARVLSPSEEIFELERGVADPTGADPNMVGYRSSVLLDKSKIPIQVRHKEFLLEVDLYMDGEGKPDKILLLCPRCRNQLSIPAARKAIDFDPHALKEFGGQLSVEPFQCTWEADSSKHGRRMKFGLGLCGWRVAIDKNVAKDA